MARNLTIEHEIPSKAILDIILFDRALQRIYGKNYATSGNGDSILVKVQKKIPVDLLKTLQSDGVCRLVLVGL